MAVPTIAPMTLARPPRTDRGDQNDEQREAELFRRDAVRVEGQQAAAEGAERAADGEIQAEIACDGDPQRRRHRIVLTDRIEGATDAAAIENCTESTTTAASATRRMGVVATFGMAFNPSAPPVRFSA